MVSTTLDNNYVPKYIVWPTKTSPFNSQTGGGFACVDNQHNEHALNTANAIQTILQQKKTERSTKLVLSKHVYRVFVKLTLYDVWM